MISEEERERRSKAVRDAIVINSTGSDAEPSEFTMQTFQRYIDGKIEQEEITQILVEHYKEIYGCMK